MITEINKINPLHDSTYDVVNDIHTVFNGGVKRTDFLSTYDIAFDILEKIQGLERSNATTLTPLDITAEHNGSYRHTSTAGSAYSTVDITTNVGWDMSIPTPTDRWSFGKFTEIPGWLDFEGVTYCAETFRDCKNLKNAIVKSSTITHTNAMLHSSGVENVELYTPRCGVHNGTVAECHELKTAIIDTTSTYNMAYCFARCYKLKNVKLIGGASKMRTSAAAFDKCNDLESIEGFEGCTASIEISYSPKMKKESLVDIINVIGQASEGATLDFGSTNLAKLTPEEIQVAVDKGWTVS